jgi:signal peptidase II
MSPFRLGAAAAVLTLAIDQANKLWLIDSFDIAARQPVRLLPWFDVVYAKNPGISYSLFSATTPAGRWGLFAAALAATVLLSFWMWRARSRRTGLALGLIVGGALGNAYDRFAYGAVADFYHFHIGRFSWYIFNLADVAIVGGVAILLFDSFRASAPRVGKIGPAEEGRL